jgi:multidrug efflux pump subunit AcrA (membrane-fusion protein)
MAAALWLGALVLVCSCGKHAAEDAAGESDAAAPVEVEAATAKTIHRTVTAEAVIYAVRQ